jgi:hypothetical protein
LISGATGLAWAANKLLHRKNNSLALIIFR